MDSNIVEVIKQFKIYLAHYSELEQPRFVHVGVIC